MREHLIWDGTTFAPAHEVRAKRQAAAAKNRSALPMPAYISDDLGPNGMECPADGRTYTSKAEYVRAVKAAGCEIIGNEKLPRKPYVKPKLSDATRREVRQRVQALDSPTRKLDERRRRRNGS